MTRILIASCLLWLVVGDSGLAGEWNQWRGPNRNGVADSSPALITKLPADGLMPQWVSEEIGSGNNGGWGSPVVADDRVYLFAHTKVQLKELGPKKFNWLAPDKRVGMSDAEYAEYERNRRDEDEARAKAFHYRESVYCLDAAAGKTIWNNAKDSHYSRFPQSGSPTVLAGRLYILGAGRQARCLDAATGKDIWSKRLPGDFRDEFWQSSFAIADGVAVLLAGHLFALELATGEIVWEGDPKKTSGTHTSPVIWQHAGREYVIVNVSGNSTICVEPKTGREMWRVTSEANNATPVVAGDRLITFGNSRKKGLRCFEMSPSAAKHVWTYNGAADKGSSPVVVGDYAFVQGEKRLACVDLKTGKAAWTTLLDLRNPQYTSLVAADDKVIYAYDGFLAFAAEPHEFTPLIEAKIDATGRMASEATFRELLGLDELEKQPAGLAKAQKLMQQKVGNHGPLQCSTPAIADGRIYVRLKKGIACYDFRNERVVSSVR